MTIQRFQATVLKLSNQTFVRHYPWLNYPYDPQLMGIEFAYDSKLECQPLLRDEIVSLGFAMRKTDWIWAIERSEEITK